MWSNKFHKLEQTNIIKHWKNWKVHQAAFSRAGEAMELSVNPLTVPTSCVLLIKILIIILTATNKLIFLIVITTIWPSFRLCMNKTHLQMNPSLSLSARRKSLRQTSSLSVATAITSIFLHSASFLAISLISSHSMDFCNHCTVGHFHFSIKLSDAASLFC